MWICKHLPVIAAVTLALSGGAALAATYDVDTPGAIADESSFGTKWGASSVFGTSGGTVTYSFIGSGTSCVALPRDCTTITTFEDFLPTGWESVVKDSFKIWSDVADISFAQVADNGASVNSSGARGDIRFGGYPGDGMSGTLGFGFYPPPNGGSLAGDVFLDIGEDWALAAETGKISLAWVLAHEIGHAIGLTHSVSVKDLMYPYYTSGIAELSSADEYYITQIYGAAAEEGPGSTVPLPLPAALLASALGVLVLRSRVGAGRAVAA